MKIHRFPATIAFALALAGPAFAADAPSFDDVDVNKDGQLTQEEASKVTDLDFAAADQDKDGKLSRAEYEAAIG
jgi:hypothetical protein